MESKNAPHAPFIQTGYYGGFSRAAYGDGFLPISISLGTPRWATFVVGNYKTLAPPDPDMLNMDEATYRQLFAAHLARLNPTTVSVRLGQILSQYQQWAGNNSSKPKYHGLILLCYEAPGQFCHRRLVAEWMEAHPTDGNGIAHVWGVGVPEHEPNTAQASLF